VIEAHEARVPLLVLTADRPPELRDVGAGQTIDQVKLYGSAAKWYLELDDAPATPERLRWLRQTACRAFWTALDGRPGPVHLNFALREPLVPDGPLPPDDGGRAGGRPWVTRFAAPPAPAEALLDGLDEQLRERPRAVVVAGRAERDPRLGASLAAFAERAGVPLLAEPTSGARRGPRRRRALRRAAARHRLGGRPRAGARPARRRPADLQAAAPVAGRTRGAAGELRPEAAWQDPAGAVATIAAADPRTTFDALAARLPRKPRAKDWFEDWQRADRVAGRRSRRCSARRAERAARGRRARRAAAAVRDAARRLLDADPRRRDVLPGRPDAAARAGQPRRERDRRHRLDRVRRRRRRARAGRRC
jgi:2-succinyl-5-enolpyruvyl-6-hydroxy-3-cyclohexene-1-carboxylate synthase